MVYVVEWPLRRATTAAATTTTTTGTTTKGRVSNFHSRPSPLALQ
jgi:hypothetical protein